MAILQDIMVTNLITLTDQDSMDKVADIFKDYAFHHLPVVAQDGRLIGVISSTDFERMNHGMTLFKIQNKDDYNKAILRSTLVSDIMTRDVMEMRPTDSVAEAKEIFDKNAIRCLPVVDKGKVVGIVTPNDIMNFYFEKYLETLPSKEIK